VGVYSRRRLHKEASPRARATTAARRATTNGTKAGVREPHHTLHDTNTGGSRQLKKGDKEANTQQTQQSTTVYQSRRAAAVRL